MVGVSHVFFAIIVCIIAYKYWKSRRFWRLYGGIKLNKTYPLIGNAHLFFGVKSKDVLKTLTKLWESQGKGLFKVQIGHSARIMLSDPENIEALLTSTTEITKSDVYGFLHRWLGDGVLFTTGNFWKQQRKILTPSFHFEILKKFIDVYSTNQKILVKKLSEIKNKVLDIHPSMQLYALDVICESSMGSSIHAQENSDSDYVKAVKGFANIFVVRSFSWWRQFEWLYKYSPEFKWEMGALETLHGIGDKVINHRRKYLEEHNNDKVETVVENEEEDFVYGRSKRVNFLDMLLLSRTSEGEKLSNKIVRDEVNTFIFAGHDTTSCTMSFALYSLANSPEVQEIAFQEQFNMFGDDRSKSPTFADLQNMPYLERVIKETLRLYPPVAIFGRVLENDFVLKDTKGTIVPSGTEILVSPYFLMRNEKYYPDPLKFDPDRFLPENVKTRHLFSFIPFSAGPRNCIGQKFAMYEIKATLSYLLRHFEFVSAGPEYDVQVYTSVVLHSANGMNLIIKDRVYPKSN